MKIFKCLAISIFLLLSQTLFSQLSETENEQLWLGYLTQSKISKNYSLWNDTHWVPDNFYIIRTGLTYHFENKLKTTTTLGYALAWFYPTEGNETFRLEQRIWGQTTSVHTNATLNFFHRFRYEARFRKTIIDDRSTANYNFNYRLRYLFQMRYNFKAQPQTDNRFYAVTSDEIMFNAGEEITNNFRLDQNRLSLGMGYQTKNMTFQLAYMKQLILSNTTDTFKGNNNLQLFIFHNFDFTKKK
jgi:hypothetical protein